LTQSDLFIALDYLNIEDPERRKKFLNFLKQYFNGYLFVGSTQPLYNPQLCLYFFRKYLRDSTFRNKISKFIDSEEELDEKGLHSIVDQNTKLSDSVFEIVRKNEFASSVTSHILEEDTIYMIDPKINFASLKKKDNENERSLNDENSLASFYYYHGLATLKEFSNTPEEARLGIPNVLIKKDVWKNLINLNKDINIVARFVESRMQTDLQDAIVLLIENALAHFDNHFYESALMLHVAHVFRELYIKDLVIKTEKEVVENGNEIKRCDLILEDSKTITIIELKRKHPQWIDFTSSNQQEAKSHGFELNSLTDTDKINYGDSYQRLKIISKNFMMLEIQTKEIHFLN